MSKLTAWVNATPERKRHYEQEFVIAHAAERIFSVMDKRGISRADLAKALGKSEAHVTGLLSGSRNMTLRTLADIAQALGCKVAVSLESPAQETPADLVGALQDKVHADSGPFRAGRSVKETPSARPEYVAAHDCACAECVEDEVRCTCKDYPGADEFCTVHSTSNR